MTIKKDSDQKKRRGRGKRGSYRATISSAIRLEASCATGWLSLSDALPLRPLPPPPPRLFFLEPRPILSPTDLFYPPTSTRPPHTTWETRKAEKGGCWDGEIGEELGGYARRFRLSARSSTELWDGLQNHCLRLKPVDFWCVSVHGNIR